MYWTAVRANRVEWAQIPAWSWQVGLAFVLLFAIVRNLTQTIS
jgi:hypothetical protein